jgi:predicted N-formylglutamate amidohydrolase
MKPEPPQTLLTVLDLPAAELRNPQGRGGVILVCEHASNAIPAALNGLGLDDAGRVSHAAWDIGAYDLALAMSKSLDAPLVTSRVSRLVYDCNRPPEAPSAIPAQSELIAVPGNLNLTALDHARRVAEVYEPFQKLLRATIDAAPLPPVLITIHSFTPVYFGQHRQTELGILHDTDARFALAMLRAAQSLGGVKAESNAPYAAQDGVTHTLREHAVKRGLHNAMLEIRNDLIATPKAATAMAAELCKIVVKAMAE